MGSNQAEEGSLGTLGCDCKAQVTQVLPDHPSSWQQKEPEEREEEQLEFQNDFFGLEYDAQ